MSSPRPSSLKQCLRHLGWAEIIRAAASFLNSSAAKELAQRDLQILESKRSLRRLSFLQLSDKSIDAQARFHELSGLSALLRLEEETERSNFTLKSALHEAEDLSPLLERATSGVALSIAELGATSQFIAASCYLSSLCRSLGERLARSHGIEPETRSGVEALFERLRRAERSANRSSQKRRGANASTKAEVEEPEEDASEPSEENGAPPFPLLGDLSEQLEGIIECDSSGELSFSDNASPAYAEAKKAVKDRRRSLLAQADRIVRRGSQSEGLRDLYWTEREGRVVLPLRSDALGQFRERQGPPLVHGTSGSGQTFYVEPQALVSGNNALRESEAKLREAEMEIRVRLSSAIAERARELRQSLKAMTRLDMVLARYRLGEYWEGHAPKISDPEEDDCELELLGARHPLMLLEPEEDEEDDSSESEEDDEKPKVIIPNDITLSRGKAMVISGPNAGGKTVSLKMAGLCVLLTRAGVPLPTARPARIPLFRSLITDVGDDQSIAANLSTFSAHLHHVRRAFKSTKRDGVGTLVLLDEVAVGTDPEQGAALAESILLELVEGGATVLVTTHYDRLKLLATRKEGRGVGKFVNAAVGFDLEAFKPTFRLTTGLPGSSSAIAVGRRLGLPNSVLAAAEEVLEKKELAVDVLLRELDAERVALAKKREELERQRQKLIRREREIRNRESKALEGSKSRKRRAVDAATQEMHALERELKAKRKEVRKSEQSLDELPTPNEAVGKARAKIREHREGLFEEESNSQERETAQPRVVSSSAANRGAPEEDELKVGDQVRIKSMKRDGELVELKGKQAVVLVGSARMRMKLSDLRKKGEANQASKRSKSKVNVGAMGKAIMSWEPEARKPTRFFGADAERVKEGIENVVDVRGERVDDAERMLEDKLAQALERDQDILIVKHGHGSGALRGAVREHLRRLQYVRRQRAGLSEEGGDAVTIVWIE